MFENHFKNVSCVKYDFRDVRIFMMIQTTKSSPDQSVKGHFWFIDVLMLIARKTHLHCNQKTRVTEIIYEITECVRPMLRFTLV